jgi:hypothetical protein
MEHNYVHETLTKFGLRRIEITEKAVYQINIVNESNNISYPISLYTTTNEMGSTVVNFEEVDYGGDMLIPLDVRKTALSLLFELEQLLNKQMDKKPDNRKLEQSNNSSMAQNEEEIKKLGKEMKQMKTNTQVLESGMVPDPIQ